MNLGRHDKEFQLERMIGKINGEAGRRQHKWKIKKTKYLWNLLKWQLLFAGQKYVMKIKKKKKINPINQTSILKSRWISLFTSPGNQGNHT